jgi:large subunit ribosomal protein L24
VVAGKFKGAEGKIMAVYPEKNRVIVESVNVIKKAQRPSQQNPRGGFVEREAAIHASNVQLLDPQTGEPTRIAYKLEGKMKLRVSAKSGAPLGE